MRDTGSLEERAGVAPTLATAALDYELPAELVAARPAEPRDAARLLVIRRSGHAVEHRHVRDLPEYVGAGDLLVFNDTAVAPARLAGRRADTGGRVEGLFLSETPAGEWRLMLSPSRRLRPGLRIELARPGGAPSGSTIVLGDRAAAGGTWHAHVEPPRPAAEVLDAVGLTPVPPYIRRARTERGVAIDDADDRRWYQTVYADAARRGSVAAPTAGLHFTPGLLRAIDARGARRVHVTLHVGPGTFKPVETPTLDAHVMHPEWYEVPAATVGALRGTSAGPGRVLAVGTTSIRALESLPDPLPPVAAPACGETALFITPPHRFRHVDGLLTNFHLPRSTLLALVAAMVGLDRLLAVYREAVRLEYRFYSYGDAMLVLP